MRGLTPLGRRGAALLQCFERSLALKRNDADARCDVGIALRRAGIPHDDAVAHLRLALKIEPSLGAAWHALRVAGFDPGGAD